MCPRSSITIPVPSRVEPRVLLLRALEIAVILIRTTAASTSSASFSARVWAGAGKATRHIASPARIRTVVILLAIVILNSSDFQSVEPDPHPNERLARHESPPQS